MASRAKAAEKAAEQARARKTKVKCLVCDKVVVDGTDGHESIYCEGVCQGWLHRWCAGLTKPQFATISADKQAPFHCARCILDSQRQEIAELKDAVAALTSQMSELRAIALQPPARVRAERTASQSLSGEDPIGDETSQAATFSYASAVRGPGSSTRRSSSSQDEPKERSPQTRKSNIIAYGVPECAKGTQWFERCKQDLASITSLVQTIDPQMPQYVIKDCNRLGKFREDHTRPRPILVKLRRSADASCILANRQSLDPPFIIKPDLSPEARAINALLMKARWSLIQKGTERKCIKIRNSKLFVNGKLHGQVVDNSFVETDKSVDPVDLVALVIPGPTNADSPTSVVPSPPGHVPSLQDQSL